MLALHAPSVAATPAPHESCMRACSAHAVLTHLPVLVLCCHRPCRSSLPRAFGSKCLFKAASARFLRGFHACSEGARRGAPGEAVVHRVSLCRVSRMLGWLLACATSDMWSLSLMRRRPHVAISDRRGEGGRGDLEAATRWRRGEGEGDRDEAAWRQARQAWRPSGPGLVWRRAAATGTVPRCIVGLSG